MSTLDTVSFLRTRDADPRDQPTEDFIAAIRSRFPTEADVDDLLTRKMQRRAGPRYRHVGIEEMVAWTGSMLRDLIEDDVDILEPRWLTGGASKVQMAFTLEVGKPGTPARRERLVVRMDPTEGSNATSRRREAELLRAFEDTLPVPKVYWVDHACRWFPEPAIIYSFLNGVAKPSHNASGRIVGLGTDFGPALREKLAPQFLEHLARIHTADVDTMRFTTMDRPETGTVECARLQLNRARRVWEEDRPEAFPLMDVAANWMQRNLPELDRVSVVHGDFRSGNFLFDEPSGRVTAWLDWERGQLGDRHRDLAWMTQLEKGHFSEDGKVYYVCGLIPLDEFYRRYEDVSGLSVDPDKLAFYRVLNCFQIITTTMATAYRVAKLGKSHQDVLLARLKGIAPLVAGELLELLKERI
ncbi:phosphotransferase family protein [Verticiella sediminum]|uniref:Phosphotransferase family protein n=1 Tax=Verticiella sediminum TaxID=1247510 RepID=A0A556B0F6_9BURK|nr:phosphotransferase family protein [Verticiella sediminum]TSH98639.1 phosphotransferase family protein [Verticiella sediminum]